MEKPKRYRMKMHEMAFAPTCLNGYIGDEMDAYIISLEKREVRAEETAKAEAGDCDYMRSENRRMIKALKAISVADYHLWDMDLSNPEEFVRWAKSVASSALTTPSKEKTEC